MKFYFFKILNRRYKTETELCTRASNLDEALKKAKVLAKKSKQTHHPFELLGEWREE